jgi:hypothetical protein
MEYIDNPLVRAQVFMYLGIYTAGVGLFEQTVAWLDQAIEISEQYGIWEWWGVCQEMLLRVRQYQGKFYQVEEIAHNLYNVSRKRNDVMKEGWSLGNLVEILFWLARDGDIAAMSVEVKRLLQESHDKGPYQQLYAACALDHMRRNEWTAAEEDAKQLLSFMAGERPTSFGLLATYTAAAEVYLVLWERQALPDSGYLRRQAELACRLLNRYAQVIPIGEPAALRSQASYAWLSGQKRRANALWNKSLARAQALSMPWEEAMTRYELGRHLPLNDPQRDKYLVGAQELFQQMGTRFYEQQVQEARCSSAGGNSVICR